MSLEQAGERVGRFGSVHGGFDTEHDQRLQSGLCRRRQRNTQAHSCGDGGIEVEQPAHLRVDCRKRVSSAGRGGRAIVIG
jgi:hypothetical protein